MDLSVENIAIGLFFILPGFISTAVRGAIVPGPSQSVGDWVVTCVIGSLTLNALALALVILFGGSALFGDTIGVSVDTLKQYTLKSAAYYVGGLYLLAIGWGICSALLWRFRPRRLAFLTHLTPVMPDEDVLTPTLAELYAHGAQAVWIRVPRERETILGKICTTSFSIEQDKPVEIHLDPGYVIPANATQPLVAPAGAQPGGIYLRLGAEDAAEIFTAAVGWRPTFPP
jgi:hypothetical protein